MKWAWPVTAATGEVKLKFLNSGVELFIEHTYTPGSNELTHAFIVLLVPSDEMVGTDAGI